MKLTYAFVDVAKLRDYALNPNHPEGRHKARVFSASLGIDQSNADWLAQAILERLPEADATPGLSDEYGMRYDLELMIRRGQRSAVVRTAWIIRSKEDFPRLTTCYVV